jgi:hypothetical protein
MSTRQERENAKSLNEKHTRILNELLLQNDNKNCAECATKGINESSVREYVDFDLICEIDVFDISVEQ